MKNRFQSKFSCSLIIDVVKNIRVYQNLVYIMQHDSITLDTLDCFKGTILQTLERMKVLPGLIRFILSDTSLFRSIAQLAPLIQLFAPAFSPDSHKFVQLPDMIENANNFTSFLQQRRNITSLNQWYFNTRLVRVWKESPGWSISFSSRDDWTHREIWPRSSVETIRSRNTSCHSKILSMFFDGVYVSGNRCTLRPINNSCSSTADRCRWRWDGEIVSMCLWRWVFISKKFNGFDIERIFNELSTLQRDVQTLIDKNKWLLDIIRQIERTDLSLTEIYQQFNNFTQYMSEFAQFQSE